MESCQKSPTRHAYTWQIGIFWQDTLNISLTMHECKAPGMNSFIMGVVVSNDFWAWHTITKYLGDLHMKFGTDIPKQTRFTLWKPCWLHNPEKINMATRRPFWKWHCWKSIGPYPYTHVLGHWSFEFIFKAKLQLEFGKQKNPIWPPGSYFESDIAENQ